MANNDILENMIKNFESSLSARLSSIEEKIDSLSSCVINVTEMATRAMDRADRAYEKCDLLVETVNILSEKNLAYEKRIKTLEDDLDDQVNRGLRETLVFKNIEGNDYKWEDTAKKLCKVIHEYDPTVSEETAYGNIERAHRINIKSSPGKAKPKNKPIVAKFSSWKFVESIKSAFREKNRKSETKDGLIYVDQMQSKKLADRTSSALMYRKEQKLEHPEWKMFISYPAKLLVKKSGDRSCQLLKEF